MEHGKPTVTLPRPNWLVIGGLALIGGILFFKPFLGVICVAAVMAYTFAPMHRWFSRKMPRHLAATVTLLATIALVVVPVVIILAVAISQGIAFAESLSNLAGQQDATLDQPVHPVIQAVNTTIAPLTHGREVVTVEGVRQFIKDVLPEFIKGFVAVVVGIAGSVPVLMTSVILYGYLFTMFTLNGESIVRTVRQISPFGAQTNDLYIERAGSIIKASLRGQLVIAFTTAVASSLLLIPLGLGPYFFFMVIILTLLGMVPLGSGILVIPICLIAMVTGQFWTGLWMLILYLLVVCNMDSFLRPRLIPKNAKLVPAITTLATFCGIAYFGILGVVYGPLIAIVLITTLDVYLLWQRQIKQGGAYAKSKRAV
jgi:predicted PurR-regulated permease PerM